MSVHRVLACWVALLAVVAGCKESEPTMYQVTGTVTFQGQPLSTGRVMFESISHRAVASPIDESGTYQLRSIEGKHAVSVVANRPVKKSGFEGLPEYERIVPVKYNYSRTSGIEVTVEKKKLNVIEIPLD